MKLATIRTSGSTRAVRLDGNACTEIPGISDVGALLNTHGWQSLASRANGPIHSIDCVSFAPVVPAPGKIICVGQNYREHVQEMGSELPDHPTLFGKFAESLVGGYDTIELPTEDPAVDWEAELAVVIGRHARRVTEADALEYVAGYSILNDVSMRHYQFRTTQWLQGKTWEKSTPFGPWLVTSDEYPSTGAAISTRIDGETVQSASTSDLVFTPAFLISYISQIVTLKPGDVIATGTPSGVGHAASPQRYLADGALLETEIEGLGTLKNRAQAYTQRSAEAPHPVSLQPQR